jgi:transcriptional regulator with XRE-family HTH domain
VTDPKTSPRTEARRKFGEAVIKLRLKSNPDMTIKEIARHSGWGPTTVSDVLHGKRFPKKEVARDIVTAFGGDFEEINALWDWCTMSSQSRPSACRTHSSP